MFKKALITFDTLLIVAAIIIIGFGINNRCENVSVYMYCDGD